MSRSPGSSRFLSTAASLTYRAGLAAEGWATNAADGGAVIIYRWSSRVIVLDSTGRIALDFDGIESIPFPEVVTQEMTPPPESGWEDARFSRIDPLAVPAAVSASIASSRIYILFAGATDNSRRIVDTYSLSDGDYLGSYLMPHAVRGAVVLRDGRLATLETDLIPTVRLWQLLDEQR